ncbi:MAG TPA: protein translocase subunit SecD [Dictyoglomaceae bacterium]|nr:protein translocase subunit SecD [Dictyoglomaceae bacterium]HOL39697.1 protein translocase subunit SecD [Dictyoglomaceae bacterium]HPP16034.1 protein translocase subunit SecD [Dictyoglomaceae bacterium]
MNIRTEYKTAFIVLLVGVALWILLTFPFRFGLDIRGGIRVTLQCQKAEGVEITDDAVRRTIEIIRNRIDQLGVTEPSIYKEGADRIVVELPGIEDPEKALEVIGQTALLEFKDESGKTVLTGSALKNAKVEFDELGQPMVRVEMNPEGAKIFADFTSKNVGKQVFIVLDGKVISNPVIQEAITEGVGVITGRFNLDEAQRLAILLRAGALPVPVKVIENRTIDPTLGKDTMEAAYKSGIIGGILVIVFMAVFFRMLGVVADLALIIYVILDLALLKLLNATLTLLGIAGIILSIGMAVDANCLIFARMREEYAKKKTLMASLDAGFRNALRAIIDSNVTTILAASILFYFGTGPIKGFAVTLSSGVLLSMFTALAVTRTFLENLLSLPAFKKSTKLLGL